MTGRGRTLRSDVCAVWAAISSLFEPVVDGPLAPARLAVAGPGGQAGGVVVPRRPFAIAVIVALMISAAVFVAAPSASGTTLQSTVMAPASGRVFSAPEEPHHTPYGGDYSFDISPATAGPVFARFRNTNGALTLTVAAPPSRACGSGVFADGGDKIVLNVLINGSRVGQVTYSHLTNFPITSGNVPVGAHIGDMVSSAHGVRPNPDVPPDRRCWTGPHVHVEPRNDVAFGCYFAGLLGTTVNEANPLGLIGGERATRINQPCGPGAETPGGPPPPTAHNPVGNLDVVERTSGGVRLAGWARDDDNAGAALQIQALVDGNPVGTTSAAGISRPDVGAHGFDFGVPMGNGAHRVCAKAINVGGGADAVLTGCVQVAQLFHDPEGNLDSATRIDGGHIRLVGQASDGDVAGPIQVQALVDGSVAGQATANVVRADVGAHGFDFTVATDWRSHQVCAKALNAGGGGVDVVLNGCVQVAFALCPDVAPTITSTKPRDDILPTSGNDVVWATGGGARIASSTGNDIICGGGATGGPGGNQIIGGPGDNLIFTGPGNNDVVAGPGRTHVISGGGHNRIAVCPNTIVLNRSAEDEVQPSGNCGPRVESRTTETAPPTTSAPAVDVTTTTIVGPPVTIPPAPTTTVTPTTVSTPSTPPPTSGEGPALCGASMTQASTAYAVSIDGVSVRQGPSPYHPASYTLGEGDPLAITCYLNSVAVEGNTRWNRLSDGLWVADAYVNTPKN